MILLFIGGLLLGFGFGMITAAMWARHEDMKNEIKKLKGTRE